MELIELAHYMNSKLENVEPNDMNENLYQKYLDKMVEIEDYEKKNQIKDENDIESKITKLKNERI